MSKRDHQIRIISLGTTGVGKTCFTAALYKRMQAKDFRLSFSTNVANNLARTWDTIATGGWPSGSEGIIDYESQLDWLGQDAEIPPAPLCEIVLTDYKGGAIVSAPSIDDRGELYIPDIELKSKLYTELSQADAVMIFVDIEKLSALLQEAESMNAILQVSDWLRKALDQGENSKRLVEIVLTKIDTANLEKWCELEANILNLCQGLIELIQSYPNLHGVILPVSVVGQGIDKENQKPLNPEPWNVETPLLYAAQFIFQQDRIISKEQDIFSPFGWSHDSNPKYRRLAELIQEKYLDSGVTFSDIPSTRGTSCDIPKPTWLQRED